MSTDKKAVISRLMDSLELHTIKRDLLLASCGLGLPWLIMTLNEDTAGVSVLVGLTLLSTLFFYIWRIICIFYNPEGYIFTKCELTQPHSNFWLKTMYFTVRIELPNGRTDYVDTHAIFAAHGIAEPRMEDYVNSTVTIAYNPATDMVVVIG